MNLTFDDIEEYPGSSKGKNPDDNPEHYAIWMWS